MIETALMEREWEWEEESNRGERRNSNGVPRRIRCR